MENKRIIKKFFEEYNSKNESNILGVLFYGSAKYHTNYSNSDIDLLIVTDSINNYKGVTYIDDVKVEYFEKNVYSLLEKVNNLETSPNRYLTSIFTNGEILFSKDQTLEYLKEEVLSKGTTFRKKRKTNQPLLNEWYAVLNMLSEKNTFFEYVYHNLLESIRKFYHEEKGYALIPLMKTYDLYRNRDYAKKFYCVDLPGKEFTNLYLESITGEYNKERFEKLSNECNHGDFLFQDYYPLYQKRELEYKSTIVDNYVSKSVFFLQSDHPAKYHYYFVALDSIRVLYCNRNRINDSISHFGYRYEEEFLSLFSTCLNTKTEESIQELFQFVTRPLKIDYRKYKVLELQNKRG